MLVVKVCKSFPELTPLELYNLLRLRSEVFVVEQNCIFLEMDNKDQTCHHLLLYQNNQLAACARLLPPGLYYEQISIGRIVTSLQARGTGLGKKLVSTAIKECYRLFGTGPIKIGAQLYAKAFYEKFGFTQTGEIYDEDGIDHIHMIKP
ncbi:GNAT family N-acetyltransferase [Adhaeribacter radiodurans]|uniref:GNAT family N-acetyltransferase n=1 Tax=Adhaeribacter radiodurans TaxID=2745197 RepID=A0A7L7L8S3_9BACT|nr:GNAT family N-acetyltransferase [Adhaeribacter radiodurans]QMU29232.1 GNAT family N-acetyltransferase [Adhaeribacter radiodurans]